MNETTVALRRMNKLMFMIIVSQALLSSDTGDLFEEVGRWNWYLVWREMFFSSSPFLHAGFVSPTSCPAVQATLLLSRLG